MTTQPRMSALAIVTVLAMAPSILQAQSLTEDPRVANAINLVDRWVDAQQAYDQIPGVSAAIVHDQEILWSAGLRLRRSREPEPRNSRNDV